MSSNPQSAETTTTVVYRRGKSLELGCGSFDCQRTAGRLGFRDNGDIVFEYRERHDGNWHANSKSLREMLLLVAAHDIKALRNLLGPELLRELLNSETPTLRQWEGIPNRPSRENGHNPE